MQVETGESDKIDEPIVEVKVVQADAFGNEKTIYCADSNAFGVSPHGALLVGVNVHTAEGGELHPLHAWAPDRWLKADVEVIEQKTDGEKVDASPDIVS